MLRQILSLATIGLLTALTPAPDPDGTARVLQKYQPSIDKGLKWLVDQQQKDGHWEGVGGQYGIAMTAFAGLAILSEGSTTREGKYAGQLRKAVDWLLAHAQENGRI